jgi:hypothetical protein
MTYTNYKQQIVIWRHYRPKDKMPYWNSMLTRTETLNPDELQFLNNWKKPIITSEFQGLRSVVQMDL